MPAHGPPARRPPVARAGPRHACGGWRPRLRALPAPAATAVALAAVVAAAAAAAALASRLSQAPPLSGWTVAVDPGHGGIHPGTCHGPSGLVEKELNLDIALKLEAALAEAGARVVLTRRGDETLSLQARADRVRESGARVLVSVHVNSFPSPDCFGAQVFFDRSSRDGERLARLVQEELRRVYPDNFREALPGDYFLLRTASVPAVLVEAGFLSSPTDRRLLGDDAFRWRLARAIARGIVRFARSEQPERPPAYTRAPAPAGLPAAPPASPWLRWPWVSWRPRGHRPALAPGLAAGSAAPSCPPPPAGASPLAGRVIAVDAGHGGEDLGAIGPSGTREKDVALAAARAVAEALRAAGATPFLTRPGDAEPGFDDPRHDTARALLDVRLQAARAAGASAFVSLHADASPLPEVAGVTTYYWDAPILARCVHQALVAQLGRRDRGTRQRDLYLLRASPVPALLVEMGFLSNPGEEALLRTEAFRQKLAAALTAGLAAYFHQARAWER